MSRNEGSDTKVSSKADPVDKARNAFQKGASVSKLEKQNTATSEITMSNFPSNNPSAFNSHASIALDDNASVKSARSTKSQDAKDNAGSDAAAGAPGWIAPSAGGDIERLTKLLYHYEVMNFNQQRDIDHYKGTYNDLAKTIGIQEKEKLKNNKKIKTLESTMKYDKIAADGIKKKYNLLEIEVKDLRYARDTLTTDLNHYKTENVELMDMLNEDRSNRLKLMHENDKLKKHNAFLVQMQTQAEECNVKANHILLERLHQLESLVAINKIQSATISGQSEEMLVLTAEVETLKSEALDISSQVISHSETNADLKNVIRLLQDEVSRLRRELMLVSMDNTQRTIGTSNSRSSSRRTNKYVATVKEVPSGGHPLLYEPLDIERRASTAMASINRHDRSRGGLRSAKVEAARRSLSPESGSDRPSRRTTARGGGGGGGEGSSSGFMSGDDSEGERRHLRVGESFYSEQTRDQTSRPPRSADNAAPHPSYFCNNEKTVFDNQKPAAMIDRENYQRAMAQSRGRSSGSRGASRGAAVVTPLATSKRPPNMDRDALSLSLGGSSTLVEEFSGLTLPGGLMSSSLSAAPLRPVSSRGGGGGGVVAPADGLEEYSQSAERVEMLGRIAQSGIKPKKKRIGLGAPSEGSSSRPKTVSSKSSSNEAASLKESISSNMKKAYSMSPKAASLYKNKTLSQSGVSLLTSSIVTTGTGEAAELLHSPSHPSGGVVPVLPALAPSGGDSLTSTGGKALTPSVSFSLGHNHHALPSDGSSSGAGEGKQLIKKQSSNSVGGGSKITSANAGPRTMYISRGLNLKHNEELDSQLNSFGAGSTKEILKKILGDREFV